MKSKTGYIIGTLKKRNESLCQENDKLKDEIERLNMELSEATHNIKTMQEYANQNQSELINKDNRIEELSSLLKSKLSTIEWIEGEHNKLNLALLNQYTETDKWKNKFNKLNTYVRNVGITIVIFGVIILFTQYMQEPIMNQEQADKLREYIEEYKRKWNTLSDAFEKSSDEEYERAIDAYEAAEHKMNTLLDELTVS